MGFGRYDYNCYNHGRFPTYSLSDNILELNKKQQKQTSFYTYLCTLLLISDFGRDRDSPPKPPAYQADKQASK